MENLIVVLAVLAILAAAIVYIRKEKKKGIRCIGCPSTGQCRKYKKGHLGGGCGGC